MQELVIFLFLALAITPGGATEGLTAAERSMFTNQVNFTDGSTTWTINAHGVPDHITGEFPTSFNPNSIAVQNHMITFRKVPTIADTPGCLGGGTIGIATNGVVLYNPYTAFYRNAVEGEHKETFDDCDGHPDMQGSYHYHKIPGCLINSSIVDQFLGVASDGFPIYGPYTTGGKQLMSADLDACHGRTVNERYQYHMTTDFPYILGCYKGGEVAQRGPGGMMGGPPAGGGGPPGGDACLQCVYANVSFPVGCEESTDSAGHQTAACGATFLLLTALIALIF